MKKIIIALFLFFFLFFTCCKANYESIKVEYNFENFRLNDNNKSIDFDVVIKVTDSTDIKLDLVYCFGVMGPDNRNLLDTIDTYVIDEKVITRSVSLHPDNYLDYLSLSINVSENNYSKKIILLTGTDFSVSLYLIAKNNLDTNLAKEIINKYQELNEIKVNLLNFTINYQDKEVVSNTIGCNVEASFLEDEIKIELVFDSNVILTKEFNELDVIVNDNIGSGKLKIIDDKYYYIEVNYLVSNISLTFDFLKNKEEIDYLKYYAVMLNPNYDIITITIELKDKYLFDKSFVLKINNNIINSNKYTIKDNKLVYTFDDPNWSGIY